jgi:hypothetical protein
MFSQTEFKGMDLTEHGEAAYPADAWVELQYKDDEYGRQSVPSVMKGAPRYTFEIIPINPM